MNLWNANCDSRIPKLHGELLRELDIWERAQGGRAPVPTGSNASNNVMRKDFDGAAWSVSHGDNYKKLIENAKIKKGPNNLPAPKPDIPSVSDETPPAAGNPHRVEAQEPPPEDLQREVVDLTKQEEIEGIETRSDSGPVTEGQGVALGNNAELNLV